MPRIRRAAKLAKVTLHLMQSNVSFLEKWVRVLRISVAEFPRRVLWDLEQTYSRLEKPQNLGRDR